MGYCCATLNGSCVTAFSEDSSARPCNLFKNHSSCGSSVAELTELLQYPAAFHLLIIASFISQSF